MFEYLKKSRLNRIISLLVITLLLSLAIQYWISYSDLKRIREQYSAQATNYFDQINRKLKETEAYMNSLVAFRKSGIHLRKHPNLNYIRELLKLFPHIRQVSIIEVSNVLQPDGKVSKLKINFISQVSNASVGLKVKPITKRHSSVYIESLLQKHESMSSVFKYNAKNSLLILKSISQPNDAYTGAIHYIALYIDVDMLLQTISNKLRKGERFTLEVDGEVVAHNKRKKKNVIREFSYTSNSLFYSKVFSMTYQRQVLKSSMQANRFMLVFTIVLAILAVVVVVWSLFINSKRSRAKAQAILRKNQETTVATMGSIEEAVIILNAKGKVEYLNPVAEKLLGYKLKQITHKKLDEIFDLRDVDHNKILQEILSYCTTEVKSASIPQQAMLWRKYKGIPIAGSFTTLVDTDGNNDGVVIVFRDLVDSIKMNKKLHYFATHDDITSLINRREFICRLQLALDKAKESGLVSVLIFLDLDQFKIVNDSCGHLVGDELLEKIARLLESNIRETDTLARLGGDEFAILLDDCNIESATEVAAKLNEAINNYHFKWQKKVFDIAASLGIVEIIADNYSVSELLSLADSACYLAKQDGRNRFHVYSADDDAMIKHRRDIQWVQRIQQAYKDNRFRLFLQEIKPLQSNSDLEYKHFEVLLRMLGDDDKVILPMSYILAAERYDKMADLDAWVIENAFDALLEYLKLDSKVSFAINLSGQSLGNIEIMKLINSKLEQAPELCKHVIFEITETAAITSPSQAEKFVSVLRRRGVRFSLDDFGTGLSSFAYLKNLKVDYIKIDGQFIRDISTDKVNFALVEAVNDIAHVMGLKTIAEYVESELTKETLKKIGIDYGQGLWFSRPTPIEDCMPISANDVEKSVS